MMASDESELVEDLVTQADSLFNTHRGSSISKVVGNLILPYNSITEVFDVSRKHSKIFDLDNMTQVFLYKYICEFSQQKVTDRLNDWAYLQVRFDLERAPTQEHISYTKLHSFTPEYRAFLKQVAREIRAQAEEHNITYRCVLHLAEPQRQIHH